MMRKIPVLFFATTLVWSIVPAPGSDPADAGANIPSPNIPSKTFNAADYGAIGDGKTLNTHAIQKAIDACSAAGGGIVLVPQGRFLTGPLKLASKLNLRLEDGATLLISDNTADYKMKKGGFENCIVADQCHDIAITGSGTIDGQGDFWWKHYVKSKAAPADEPGPAHRPYMVVFNECKRVRVEGVTLTNSPSFHLVPALCQDVVIQNVHFLAPAKAPNTDALDPSGWNFLITRCTFDVGDDCIAVKASGNIEPGHPSCENITVTDCTFLHGHGMSIGGQTRGGLRHMIVRDCTFKDTDAGIRMKAGRGAGGLVEDVAYEHLTMDHVKVPIFITSYYPTIPSIPEDDAAEPVGERTPIWRNIRISDVTITNSPVAGRILGLPEMPVSDVVLTNVSISAEKGMQIVNARNIKFVNSGIAVTSGPPLIMGRADVTGLADVSPTTGH
jgi:polygalacturonase